MTILLKKRLFSSPRAFDQTLRSTRTLAQGAARAGSTERQLRADFDRTDEDVDDDEALNEARRTPWSPPAGRRSPHRGGEREARRLLAWAERERTGADAKTRVLIDWLEADLRPGGAWNDERVIVFTEYRDTQNWLDHLLRNGGIPAERMALLFGGWNRQARAGEGRVPGRPNRRPCASCSPPTPPARASTSSCTASGSSTSRSRSTPTGSSSATAASTASASPAPSSRCSTSSGKDYETATPGTIDGDLDFLFRIAQRIETIREDLGSTGEVIAQQVEEAMLGRRRDVDEAAIDSSRAKPSRAVLRSSATCETKSRGCGAAGRVHRRNWASTPPP